MNSMKYLLSLCFFLCFSAAQAGSLDDSMHAAGKMNVVIGVVALVFIGIVIYLFLIDRRLKRIEKEWKDKSE